MRLSRGSPRTELQWATLRNVIELAEDSQPVEGTQQCCPIGYEQLDSVAQIGQQWARWKTRWLLPKVLIIAFEKEVHFLTKEEFLSLNAAQQLNYFWGPDHEDTNGEFLVEAASTETDYNPLVYIKYVQDLFPLKWKELVAKFGDDLSSQDLAEACYDFYDELSDEKGVAEFDLFQARYIYKNHFEELELSIEVSKEAGLCKESENIYKRIKVECTDKVVIDQNLQ